MRKHLFRAVLVLTMLAAVAVGTAKDKMAVGVIAASVGDDVVLANPTTGASMSLPTGPVAWLFPAPGGVLFAPDLVNGSTTVVNLRTGKVQDTFSGITMPHFGDRKDRYVVAGRQMLLVSYPERALMKRLEASFEHPWQVEVLVGSTIALVLERLPEGGEAAMTAVKIDENQVVYRQELAGDVRYFALSQNLGVLALADAENRQVLLVEPATLSPITGFPLAGRPMDLVFAGDGSLLVVAVANDAGGGSLEIWKMKASKKNGLERAKEWKLAIAGDGPYRMAAAPDGRHVVVGSGLPALEIFDVASRELSFTVELEEAPRDVVWADPGIEGPLLPDWSDEKPPELDLGQDP